jgi:hypothetical protein
VSDEQKQVPIVDRTELGDTYRRSTIGLFPQDVAKALTEAGIIPTNCRRFIIDSEAGEVVKVYYECYGDVGKIQLLFEAVLKLIPTKERE